MQDQDTSQYHQVAVQLAKSLGVDDRALIASWAEKLLRIRDEPVGVIEKSRRAMQETMDSKVVWPVAKTIGKEIKRLGWDERGTKSRFALVGSAAGIALFGGQSAGIAALGTAIGVPLWIVLGAGGAFAAVLLEELRGNRNEKGATYRVIDAEKED
jgi:hypothetical protein